MSKSPFILVPWQRDFMTAILDIAIERQGGVENALFIFPHTRPARYLERLISEDPRIKKPCLMPECLTGSQIFQSVRDEACSPATPAGKLDRIGLLLECLRDEQREHPGLINRIPSDDARAFFPWGQRLANIFEECFNHRREPENFLHLEDEIMPFAAAILSRMSSLYRRYIGTLESGGRTTPGFTAKKAVEALDSGHRARVFNGKQNIYICGFYNPGGTEDALFKRLWQEREARIIIHADPALQTGKAHWSCSGLGDWQKSWGAGFDVLAAKQNSPSIKYYAGYDVHSQLAFLRSSIHQQGEEHGKELEDTAIILPDTTLLLPVLHHIQAEDVNISMGYPLSNTALQRFLGAITTLHENTRNGFYWKDCIRFLRQPYLKMLDENRDKNDRNLWRELLLKAERRLREGKRYVNLVELIDNCLKEFSAEDNLENLEHIWRNVKETCIERWRHLSSLEDLADNLEKLVRLLLERGEHIWPRFPIDAECLSRFASSLVPELKNSFMARESLPQRTIFAIFHELSQAERIPFDAYPLTVLQIMGLLESRLLSFKNIFILDATDDILPGGIQNDPLLPDSLRAELGLPDSARRQRLTAYYFFRLLQSTENIHIFWQEGVEPQGVMDAKKLRSRFVEELLWREEQKLGRLLEPRAPVVPRAPELPPLVSDGPLFQIGSRLMPFRQQSRDISISESARAGLGQMLASSISATRLNKYIRCPAEFYYSELANLEPPPHVAEDEDPRAVGDMLHQVLKDYYSGSLDTRLENAALSRSGLMSLYRQAMLSTPAIDDLPSDARIMLGLSGERRLRNYLDKQPESTTVRALELPVTALLSTPEGTTFQLFGKLDRIDERIMPDGKPGLVILDYKTGRSAPVAPEIWTDGQLWQGMSNGEVDFSDREFFCRLADSVHDVQLPFYLYLASFGDITNSIGPVADICNAALVDLREKGEENFIFPHEFSRELRTEIIEDKISLLLDYFLRHLAQAKNFFPRPGPRCNYCDYHNICIVLSQN